MLPRLPLRMLPRLPPQKPSRLPQKLPMKLQPRLLLPLMLLQVLRPQMTLASQRLPRLPPTARKLPVPRQQPQLEQPKPRLPSRNPLILPLPLRVVLLPTLPLLVVASTAEMLQQLMTQQPPTVQTALLTTPLLAERRLQRAVRPRHPKMR